MSCETAWKVQCILYSFKYMLAFKTVKRERERFMCVPVHRRGICVLCDLDT